MTPKERILRQIRGQEIDRVPTIGGWMNGLRNIAEIGGITVEQYLADPLAGVVRANRALGVDGMVPPIIPRDVEQIRDGQVEESKFAGIEPEALKAKADSLGDTEKEILAKFDPAAAEAKYRKWVEPVMKAMDDIVMIPTIWEMSGWFPLYMEFGYEAFLMACSMYPAEVGKLWWADSVISRKKAEILLKLYKEYDWVPLCFSGQDECNNKGPMVAPEFLREHYWPHVRQITKVLTEAGIRLVHHCDGDVRLIVDDFVGAGFSGFQGFQYEVGVDPYELKKRRSLLGEEMLFFAGMSVTRTLPFGTVQDVRDEIDYILDYTDGGRNCFLFSSNVIGVEVPTENSRTGFSYIKTWDATQKRQVTRRQWPWAVNHPEDRY